MKTVELINYEIICLDSLWFIVFIGDNGDQLETQWHIKKMDAMIDAMQILVALERV